MRCRTFIIAAACSVFFNIQAQTAAAPPTNDAVVVFFTPGGFFRGWGDQLKHSPWGKADMASFGNVFEGKERVVKLDRARLLKVHFTAGVHTFSSNISSKKPSPKELLTLELLPGSVTYLAETATMMNYTPVLQTFTSHLSQTTCTEFKQSLEKDKLQPAQTRLVAEQFLDKVDDDFVLPACVP